MKKPIDKNLGKSPSDPEYDPNYDYEAILEQYEWMRELQEDERRGER